MEPGILRLRVSLPNICDLTQRPYHGCHRRASTSVPSAGQWTQLWSFSRPTHAALVTRGNWDKHVTCILDQKTHGSVPNNPLAFCLSTPGLQLTTQQSLNPEDQGEPFPILAPE